MKAVAAYATVCEPAPGAACNEDACLVVPKRQLFGVADGFGGIGIGDEAAKLALDHVGFFVENGLGDHEVTLPFVYRTYQSSGANLVFNALLYANRQLIEQNKTRHINARGGASVCFAFFDGPNLTLANVGSNCAWLIRDGEVRELVRPRSYNAFRGPQEKNPEWAFPLMALGMAGDLEPEIFEARVKKGDVVVMASDGFYLHLNASELAAYGKISQNEGVEGEFSKLNQALIDKCRSAGCGDNISIVSMVCDG